MVLNICPKTRKIPCHGATGANKRKFSNRREEEASPKTEAPALAAGHASAVKLKNAKAAPHSVVRSGREHKDGDDDDGDGDDAAGSGANSGAPTKVDKQVATMTPWVSSSDFKSIL
jgi:uncharacterized membrane protein